VVLKLLVVPVEDVSVMLPVEFAKDVKEVVVKVVVDLKPVVVLLLSLSVELKA
jgi:predicted Zn-dependent protease with MMP-like domain